MTASSISDLTMLQTLVIRCVLGVLRVAADESAAAGKAARLEKGYDGDRAPLKEWEARAHTLLPLYIARDAGSELLLVLHATLGRESFF